MAHKNFVWIHDDEDAFAKANIITQDETKTVVEWQGGDRTLDTAECLKVNPDNQDGGARAPPPPPRRAAPAPPPGRRAPRPAPPLTRLFSRSAG